MKPIFPLLAIAIAGAIMPLTASSSAPAGRTEAGLGDVPTLEDAQRLFYNGRYEAAAELTLALCAPQLESLAACELRTSTLHFQIKRAQIGRAHV